MRSVGLGGAASISYARSGCASQWALFDTSSKYELGNTLEFGIAAQVVFIIAGCTHKTFYKVLKHALGTEAVTFQTFHSTIKRMYPIVVGMVDRMCKEAKCEMHHMDQSELGS